MNFKNIKVTRTSVTALVSLSFGLLAACSDEGNPSTPEISEIENQNPAIGPGDPNIGNPGLDISSSSVAGISGPGILGPGAASSSSTGILTPESSSAGIVPPNGGNSVGTITPEDEEHVSNGNNPVITYSTAGASVASDNGCVTVNGGEVLIKCAGDYDFSGSYKGADAQIRVYSPKADSGVYLNLRGLTLENTADAPIYVQMASKTFVVAKSETVNTLSDGSTRTKTHTYVNSSGVTKTDTTNAAIYSKDDMTFKGTGTLIVAGNYNNGIQSSNDLRFRGETTINVTAKNNGIKGKGSVQIGKGTLKITTTEGDGIKSDECVENAQFECTGIVEGKGIVEITGGTITIKAGDDGIQAVNQIRINETDGAVNIDVTAGDGTPDKGNHQSNNFGGGFGGFGGGNWGGPGGNNGGSTGNTGNTSSSDTTVSNKGIVAADSVIIEAGTIKVASTKDAIHSNGYVDIKGGNMTLAGRNAVHADEVITIFDGTLYMTDTFEALEARQIIAKGGVTDAVASNDGWNAGTGNEGCTGNCKIEVTGGLHHMHVGSGDTDGMDSNQSLSITGGVVVVECEMNGGMGGSFDAERTGTITLTSKTMIGFGKKNSEEGKNYSVSFGTSGYYGTSSIAFKPTFSGSIITTGGDQPSTVSNVSSYANSYTFPSGVSVYYNN